jgi:preprotein translocase subunit SecE
VAKSTKSKAVKKTKKENPIVRYFKETRAELRKVTWPSRQETINLTVVVLVVTVGMAAYLGFIDYIFSKIVALLIS